MIQYFVEHRSARRILRQDSGNQIFGSITDLHMFREGVAILFNAVVSGFNIGRLKRRLANYQCVNDDAERPNIDLVRVARLALENLRRNIIRSSADGPLALSIEVDLGSKTEVADLYLHFLIDKQIAEFEIPVDHSVRVQILEGANYLQRVALHLQFVEPLPPFEQVVERLVLADFEENVNVLCIFEKVIELANMLVLQTPVDFDFAHQLLLGATLGERSFLHNFASP
jgi:hypothetical protein